MELHKGSAVMLYITVTCVDCNQGLVYLSIIILGFSIPFLFGHLCGYTFALAGMNKLLAKLRSELKAFLIKLNELKSANTELESYTSGDVEKGVLNK